MVPVPLKRRAASGPGGVLRPRDERRGPGHRACMRFKAAWARCRRGRDPWAGFLTQAAGEARAVAWQGRRRPARPSKRAAPQARRPGLIYRPPVLAPSSAPVLACPLSESGWAAGGHRRQPLILLGPCRRAIHSVYYAARFAACGSAARGAVGASQRPPHAVPSTLSAPCAPHAPVLHKAARLCRV